MARPRKISAEKLIEGTKQYFENICQGDTKLLKYPQIASYISTLYGVSVADYDLKKCSELKEYITSLKNSSTKQFIQKNIYFKRLDVENFLRTHSTPVALKRALVDLDSHYEQVNEAAERIMEENKRLLSALTTIRQENTLLVTANEELTSNVDTEQPAIAEMKTKIKEQEQRIKTLVKIIEDNVYPELANELLAEVGFLKTSKSIVSEAGKSNILDDTDSISNLIRDLTDF